MCQVTTRLMGLSDETQMKSSPLVESIVENLYPILPSPRQVDVTPDHVELTQISVVFQGSLSMD